MTALGMKVSYYNRRKLSEELEAGATYVSSLDEVSLPLLPLVRAWLRVSRLPFLCGLTRIQLLKQTDVLSVHVPLSDATKGLIGARELALLPKGATVINTSRGPCQSISLARQSKDFAHIHPLTDRQW